MNAARTKRKPIALHIHDPKKHMGAEEKKARAEAELVMGDMNFLPPIEVKKNVAAMRKWREVTKIYKEAGLTFVSSTDSGVIGRYCMLNAEYEDLLRHRRRVGELEFPEDDQDEIFAMTAEAYGIARARRLWRIMEYFTGLDGLIKLDKIIDAKAKAILDVEDRIFLNPAAKVRTLPIQRKPKEADPMEEAGFNV